MRRTSTRGKQPRPPASVAVSILAGGRSSRMGRDKTRLRLGGRSLLQRVRAVAQKTGWPVRVIRKDLVARCGPLGGIYTALESSQTEVEVFLACDMPFVSTVLLIELLGQLVKKRDAVFATIKGTASFPLLLRVGALPVVAEQIRRKRFSVQALATALRAGFVEVPRQRQIELFNINTIEDWERAKDYL